MSLSVSSSSSSSSDEDPPPGEIDIHLPPEIDWHMLDKSRFFLLGAALFSGVSASLYPAVVLKTRIQVSPTPISCFRTAASILRLEGPQGFYRGFATSLAGTVPARALYMAALELTKTTAAAASARLGLAADTSAAVAAASNAVAGLSAAVAAQIVWTPVDVVSQRLMVQQQQQQPGASPPRYRGGLDAFRQIVVSDGIRGLYRGFGMSVLTYAPSNAVWWASYSLSQRVVWRAVRRRSDSGDSEGGVGLKPDCGAVVAVVQGMSAAMAGGAAALVTMPLDTIKTRMQVMDGCEEEEGRMTIGRAVKSLRKEGGWMACYRGLGPRWASMSLSATTMITTYEFLKRLSAKDQGSCG